MSGWDHSVFIIVTAALQDKTNRLTCALGYDVLPGNTFSVALSSDGAEPATHYGCRSWVKQEFIDIIKGAGLGLIPEIEWGEYGVTIYDIAEVIGSQIFDVQGAGDAAIHFDDVAGKNGLQQILLAE